MNLLFMFIKQKMVISFLKNYILIILVDFYASFLLPGSGSTFPEVDPDPAKWYGSGFERLGLKLRSWDDLVAILQGKCNISRMSLEENCVDAFEKGLMDQLHIFTSSDFLPNDWNRNKIERKNYMFFFSFEFGKM